MTDLPDDFFKDFEKTKSVPGAEATEKAWPDDDKSGDLKGYLDKAGVDSLVLHQGKLPPGSVVRRDMWYDYHSESPGEVIGSDGACTLYKVKVTCRVHVKFIWVRTGQPDVVVGERYYMQWIAWKQFMVCPDGAVTDLGVLNLINGGLKPDSKVDQSKSGATAPGVPPAPPAAPPFVYNPPSGIPDVVYAQLNVRENGINYLETRSYYWELVSRTRKECQLIAVYAKKLRFERRALPDGKPEPPRWEDANEQRVFVFEIPNCTDGKALAPVDGNWQPPASYYTPTAATTKEEGGHRYSITSDSLWVRVANPPMQVKDCIATVSYQLYYRVETRDLDDPSAKPVTTITAADPAQIAARSFRVLGCVEELKSMLPGPEAGAQRAFDQRATYEELRAAVAVATGSDSDFDLRRARALLTEGVAAVDARLAVLSHRAPVLHLDPVFAAPKTGVPIRPVDGRG